MTFSARDFERLRKRIKNKQFGEAHKNGRCDCGGGVKKVRNVALALDVEGYILQCTITIVLK